MPYSADIVRHSRGGTWILRKGPDNDPAYPVRVFVNRESLSLWRDRYAVGVAVSGATCGVVVIDRVEPVVKRGPASERIKTRDGLEIPIHRSDGVLVDERGAPIKEHIGRKVVSLVYQEMPPTELTDIVRRIGLYYRAAMVNVVANQQGMAVIGALVRGEHCPMFLRPGAVDEMGVSWQEKYGSVLTVGTRESFFGVLTVWMEALEGFRMPQRVKESCLSVLRAESGALPADVLPQTALAVATCAAIHAQNHAQAVGKAVEKPPPGPHDYGYRPAKEQPKGDGAWWAMAMGVR